MNVTRRALGACAAALLAWLCVPSGASAQSRNPIKVGMSLALTGAGAPAGKMLQAAIEIWRDDVNAKGGLLGRPVEIIVYDDQSNPASVPGLYTKLITVDKADLLVGPYGTNFVAPAMPTIIQNKKMLISYTAIGINRAVQLRQVLLDGAGRLRRRERLLQGLLRDGGAAEAETADGRDPRRRRRVRPGRGDRRARGAEEARLQARLRQELSASDHRLHAGGARGAGGQRRHRLSSAPIRPTTSASCAPPTKSGLNPKMFGGAMIGMLITPIKVQLGPITNGLVIPESFVPSPKLQLRRPRRPDEALSGQGGES